MHDLVPLFPPYGIDQTIHVAILIGVLLLLGLTETFGWVFSGLVVPGYLASLFVLEPASGATVAFEAVLTYAVARVLSSVVSRSGAWSSFFGRERFLLLIFVSIAVRQACELWVIPDLMRVLDDQLGTTYRLTRTFSSVGLVLVPLTANMFWKLGLRRGGVQIAVPTLLTFAVLAYVLLPYTNLSFARLEITYENVALDFLSSPKAYILLVTGAYLGSRYNLLYGWDYAGILVPALLTLAWLSPLRLVTTLFETVMLVVVVRALIAAPGIRTLNLEGPRKVALVFAVSFLLKWGLGWIAGPTVSDLRVTDLFGFGYLLSSLIAVKILQKDTVARIAMPTVLVSMLSLVIGSAVGFGLDRVAPPPPPAAVAPAVGAPPAATTVLARSARGVLALAHVRARLEQATDLPLARSSYELDRYRELWAAIASWLAKPGPPPAEVERRAAAIGLVLRPIGELAGRPAWGLFEIEERLAAHVGWDTAVLVPGARGPVIAVPHPATQAPTAEAAALLCERVACRAVVASGLDLPRARAEEAEDDGGTAPHAVVRRSLRAAPALELRADPAVAVGKSVLHVANEAPDVEVAALWPRGLELSWQPAPGSDRPWGASVLRAHSDDYWAVVTAGAGIPTTRGVSIEAWFARWFERGTPAALAARGTAQAPVVAPAAITAPPPSQSELRFFELLVARPALAGQPEVAHAMGALVGYGVTLLGDGAGPDAACWVLAETARPRRLGWGVLAGRVARDAAPLAIEVPRPRREPGTWRIGVELWRHADAATLIVADAEVPDVRQDADPAATWNVATAFQALHQAVHASSRRVRDALILQVRGFAATQPIREPIIATLPRPALVPDLVPRRLTQLLSGPRALELLRGARVYDGAREHVDVAGTGNPQLHYCARFDTVHCAMLWFSEPVREAYREVDRDRELAKLARMGVPRSEASAVRVLIDPLLAPPAPGRVAGLRERFAPIERALAVYATEHNVQQLRVIAAAIRATPGASWHGGYSDELGRPFLIAELRDGDHAIRGLVLVPAGSGRVDLLGGADGARSLPALLARRPAVITVVGARDGE